jgi:murein DD-endopeptidase MepM/ murein hydrolase activator NlpD
MTQPPACLARRWFPLALCFLLPATPPAQRVLETPSAAAGTLEPGASPLTHAAPSQVAALTGNGAPLHAPAAPAAIGPVPGGVDNAPAPSDPAAPRTVTVRRGDTLAEILTEAGIDRADAEAALAALTEAFPAHKVQPGHVLILRLDPKDATHLTGLTLEPEPGRRIRADRAAGRWTVAEDRTEEARRLVLARGEIRDGAGLAPSLQRAGLPPPLALALVRLLGHEVDFQRDLQPGDRFTVLFERFRDAAQGSLLRDGALVHVELQLSGRRLAWWRHPIAGGEEEEDAWFDEEGRSLRRGGGLLRTPLDGARLSSAFGDRAHPILGFTRLHRGVDFAAPSGTPVFAAADGTVEEVGFQRGYGRTIRLRHAAGGGEVETLYAHLSGFARGLKPGAAVRQGEVIGKVGASGLATGPHLHYEVRIAGQAVDPARATAVARGRERLEGRALAAFHRVRGEIQAQLAGLAPFQEVAWAE